MASAKMTNERWQKIEELFHSASELAPEARAQFLAGACGEGADLRQQVEALLAASDEAGDFIEASPMAKALSANQSLPAASLPAASLIGRKIGHYEITSLLGAGGMGEVYLARDVRLDRQIALKLLPAQFTSDAEQVRRFEREARAASALNHPNIMAIYDIGQEAGRPFIAMELVTGVTLREKLRGSKLELRESLRIASQIASALSAAHAARIIHSDIKPENVMLRENGLVKLLDFGQAKLVGELESGSLSGTLAYLSPEQARGEKVDHRTDIFSLGIVLYEMIEGTRPFTGDSSAAVLAAIVNDKPIPVGPEIARLPDKLTEIINRALAKDRESRYQQAEEMGDELRKLARKFEPASGVVADAGLPSQSTIRNRWLMKTAIALGVLLAAFGIWRLYHSSNSSIPSPWIRATATRLTGYQGEEFTPSFSPDEKSIIFVHQVDGDFDICRQRLGESSFTNLTPDCDSADIQPAFSPDGSQIAFRSDCNGGGIFVMPATGGISRRVSDAGYNPVWSTDGKEILYSTGNALSPHIRRTAGGQLWAVKPDTLERRHLQTPDAMQPTLSPRGLRIAYWGVNPADQHQRDIWTVDAQGGKPVAVTNDAALDWNPVWSPDGHLYFVSNRAGTMNLWRVPIEEATGKVPGPPEAVTGPSSETWHPSFSRDGKRLIYVQRNVRALLETAPFDPETGSVTDKAVIVTEGTQRLGFPDLSPDGNWLAYYNFGEPQEDIFIIKLDGSQLLRLTNDKCKDRMPRWSPDGKQIAFYSDCSGSDQIWMVNRETGQRRQITFQSGAGAQYPAWSPDGSHLAFHSRGAGTFILDEGKSWQEQTPIALKPAKQAGRWFIAWSWSADGQRLAGVMASADEDYPGIWTYEIKSGQYGQLTKIGAYPIWLTGGSNGSNVNRRLLFSDEHKLYLADALSLKEQTVLSLQPGDVNYGVPARNSRRIYYTVRLAESDIHELSLP